ncbi:hypothetical protein [Rothia halotolerans]|uniref:hypothetical protein n=1 Tax=Rothia halotolerans TaxID=405770 RepID=UPI00101D9982|nr:hypothetical protein [Rothia halotolerans]
MSSTTESTDPRPSAGSPASQPGGRPKRTGRKRAIVASGSLLGIAALVTGAALTDYGLLNFNGSGGFGGEDNAYNLQFSTGQEATVASVQNWVEANPDAETVAPISGADSLVPGGAPVYINLPVLNASATFKSSLDLGFENITPGTDDAGQAARNAAYADLLRVDVAQVDDASTTPTDWKATDVGFGGEAKTPGVGLEDLDPEAGSVVVARVYLVDGATQDATNAANGGTVNVQARFDGSSKN